MEASNPLESALADAPRNAQARTRQEELWAGTFDENARAQFSQREIAKLHRRRIEEAIAAYHIVLLLASCGKSAFRPLRGPLERLSSDVLGRILEYLFSEGVAELLQDEEDLTDQLRKLAAARLGSAARADQAAGVAAPAATHVDPFRVALRVRPLMPFELSRGEYNCIHVRLISALCASAPDVVMCHDGHIERTGRRVAVAHRRFCFDRAWDGDADDAAVFRDEVLPLLNSARAGGRATVLCYGQTGTGKTHTLMACIREVCRELADAASDDSDAAADEGAPASVSVSVRFFEIHGEHCYDLLRQRKRVFLRAAADESVHVRGAATASLTTADVRAGRLREVLRGALALRSSEATERNPLSSRSHAVLQLQIHEMRCTGMLTLVDLAGSERNYETTRMTAAQHRESALINKALMALKDCFRAFNVRQEAARRGTDDDHNHGTGRGSASAGRATRSRLRPKTTVRAGAAAETKGTRKPKAIHRLALATHLKPATAMFEGTIDSAGNSATPEEAQTLAEDAEARARARATRGRGERSLQRLRRAEASRDRAMAAHRLPFRASRLTQLLRGCFTERGHRSVIITTASPSPTDITHSINSSAHVVLTKPELSDLVHSTTCESSVNQSGAYQLKPVSEWAADDVNEWVCSVSNGEFSHMVLPSGVSGGDLLRWAGAGVADISALFEGSMRDARGGGEGQSWNIGAGAEPVVGAACDGAGEAEGAGESKGEGGGSGEPASATAGGGSGAAAEEAAAGAAAAAAAAASTGTGTGPPSLASGAGADQAAALRAIGTRFLNALLKEQSRFERRQRQRQKLAQLQASRHRGAGRQPLQQCRASRGKPSPSMKDHIRMVRRRLKAEADAAAAGAAADAAAGAAAGAAADAAAAASDATVAGLALHGDGR
eukprot:g6452.t1